MQKLGIIALECERLTKISPFYAGRHKRIEKYLMSDDIEIIAVYAGKNTRRLSKVLLQNGVTYAICTKPFADKFGMAQLQGIKIVDGTALYKRLLPDIIKKAAKLSRTGKQERVLAICGDDPSFAFSLIKDLFNDFRYVKIISKNKKKVCEVSEKILDEFGIPIIVSDTSSKVKCDVALKIGKQNPSVSKYTIVIDAGAEHTITRKNTISWVELSLCHNIPFDVDSLSAVQAIQMLTGKKDNFRITGFRCGKGKTIFDMGKRIDNI